MPTLNTLNEPHLLTDLIDNTSEVIMILAPDLSFLYVNQSFHEVSGFTKKELEGLKLTDLLHPQYADDILSKLKEVEKGIHVQEFRIVIRNKEKQRIYLSGDINCGFKNGKPLNFRCLLRDITQRRRAEKAQNLYYSIAQSNLNTSNLEEFLQQVHEELQKNLYANNFFVAVYEKEEATINFPYHVDEYYETERKYLKRKVGNGIIEYAMVQSKPLLFYKKDLERLKFQENVVFYGTILPAIQMIVPLRIQGKATGVIGIKSYSDATKFGKRDMELLEFVSGQVALALQRKKSEADLLLQTARLNAVFDSSTHFIWTVDQKRHLSSFNRNYYDLIQNKLGTPPQVNVSTERLGWKLIAPDDRPTLREKYNLAFEGKPQYFEMNWGEIDGGDQWYEFYLNPILTAESGVIEEVSGIARNITEKKNAIIRIQKSEEKFRNIIESFIDIYYRTDLAGNVTMISPSVETHTGYPLQDVMGKKVDYFFENAEDSSQNIKSLLKNGSITNFEVQVKRKDGTLRQFMLNIRMIKNSKGIPKEVEGVARDITELKKSSEELVVAKEEAERSLKVKEQFLANMSHEIRTPMNGIIGMIDVLNETKLEKEQKDYVHTIKKSSETLLTILNDILDLSKIEAGKMELIQQPLAVVDLLENIISLFQQKAFEKGNKIEFNIDKNVPKAIIGDRTRLLQILSNLTSNALKFTNDGLVQIIVSKVPRKKNYLKFEIKDEGIGISTEDQEKLFTAFQQLDNSTSKSFGGTGLGLAISRELCTKMKGEMGVESELGKGSNFWFTIKAEPALLREVEKHKESDEINLTNYFKKAPKILLVDDNHINRKVASEILSKAGCEVTPAESGQEAIDIFTQNQSYDTILMDIQMPVMDGIQATKKLKEKFGKKLPTIVAMTAYSMQDDKEKFLANGMDDYVSKPIRAQTLIEKIDEIVNGQKKTQKIKDTPAEDEVGLDEGTPRFDAAVIDNLMGMVGRDMIQSIFEDFEKEAHEQIENTYQAYLNKDVEAIQKELHTLKGNSGTIGLMRIHEITKKIEVPSKVGDLSHFEERYKILKSEFDSFQKEYKSL